MKHCVMENGEITGVAADPSPSTTEIDESSQQWMDYQLSEDRREKVKAIKAEGVSRVSAVVPALNSLAMIELMAELWPMLDTASAGADMVQAKDIYVYAKSQIQAMNSADQATVDAYDPATDPNWP